MTYDLTYVSFGAGVQSTALLVCSNLGLYGVPKADVAFFADTLCEPSWVYAQVERMRQWSKIPVEVVRAPEKKMSVKQIMLHAPLWIQNERLQPAPLRRMCTSDYKVYPIRKAARGHVGVGRKRALALIGISVDEFQRMKDSRIAWITNGFPLVDAGLSREDCKRIVQEQGLPVPLRSACLFCPYHSMAYWKTLRDNFPEEWRKLCEMDEMLIGVYRGKVKSPLYFNRQLRRMSDVNFRDDQRTFSWADECGGLCGL